MLQKGINVSLNVGRQFFFEFLLAAVARDLGGVPQLEHKVHVVAAMLATCERTDTLLQVAAVAPGESVLEAVLGVQKFNGSTHTLGLLGRGFDAAGNDWTPCSMRQVV